MRRARIGHCSRKSLACLDGQPRMLGSDLPNEAVRGAGVDQRDEVRRAHVHLKLYSVIDGQSVDRV